MTFVQGCQIENMSKEKIQQKRQTKNVKKVESSIWQMVTLFTGEKCHRLHPNNFFPLALQVHFQFSESPIMTFHNGIRLRQNDLAGFSAEFCDG
jgi:hypothetical protein